VHSFPAPFPIVYQSVGELLGRSGGHGLSLLHQSTVVDCIALKQGGSHSVCTVTLFGREPILGLRQGLGPNLMLHVRYLMAVAVVSN